MTQQRFQGKVALVTGSSRGLGRVTAERLASEGATVIINSSNTPIDGRLVSSEINRRGGRAVYARANVADEQDVIALARLIGKHFGRLDVLIHNAAGGCDAPAVAVTREEFDRAFLTNTYALVTMGRNLTPLMPPGSAMLYVSSFGAIRAVPGYAVVGASKAASEAMVRSMSLELAPQQIRINAVRPGVIPTVSLRSFSQADVFIQLAKEEAPLGMGTMDDIVNAMLFFVSPEAGLVTGQVLEVDGGWSVAFHRNEFQPHPRAEPVAPAVAQPVEQIV